MMDCAFYREITPTTVWSGQDPPEHAACGANNASLDYASGLLLSVYKFGNGRFVFKTFRIRENVGKHPLADRLPVNVIDYAAQDRHISTRQSFLSPFTFCAYRELLGAVSGLQSGRIGCPALSKHVAWHLPSHLEAQVSTRFL